MKADSANPRGSQTEALFNAALKFPVAERTAFLADACATDAALRQRVEALLRAHDQAEGFLPDQPAQAAGALAPGTPPPEDADAAPAQDGADGGADFSIRSR